MIKSIVRFAVTVFIGCLVLIGTDNQAQAAGESVTVDGIVLSRCGAQGVPLSGTTSYSGTARLQVRLDGVLVLNTQGPAGLWITSLIPISVGQHTVAATLYAASDEGLGAQLASDSKVFTVAACQQVRSGGGGGGDEKDCCPGKDPEEVTEGKVLGATTDGDGAPAKKLISLKGEVYNLADDLIEVKYAKADGTIVYRKFHMTDTTEMRDHIRLGSQVKIYFEEGSNVAQIVQDLSPDGMENLWGAVNESPIYD